MTLPPIDWPAKLGDLLSGVQVVAGHDGKRCCRVDADVDAETLFLLNEFDTHARHRRVRIRLTEGSGCISGEMNAIIGLGKAANPGQIGKVRISFHDVLPDDCTDRPRH